MRIGHGFDVHACVEGRPLILGGVEISAPFGLDGHSDADVLTHAVMDALLGAARMGDIGALFPDTDPQYRNISSLLLARNVAEMIHAQGFEIVDIDTTLAAQSPKLAPYREEMRTRLADALGIDRCCMGIKATTTEHLGFVGRSEGIAAWAVALLRLRTDRL